MEAYHICEREREREREREFANFTRFLSIHFRCIRLLDLGIAREKWLNCFGFFFANSEDPDQTPSSIISV